MDSLQVFPFSQVIAVLPVVQFLYIIALYIWPIFIIVYGRRLSINPITCHGQNQLAFSIILLNVLPYIYVSLKATPLSNGEDTRSISVKVKTQEAVFYHHCYLIFLQLEERKKLSLKNAKEEIEYHFLQMT